MLLLPAILTGIGLLALLLGLRGRRIGTEPRCRKCLFSLEGLTNPAVCPECGRDVTTPKSTRRGVRRRNVKVIVAALVLLLGGGAWLVRNTHIFLTAPGWESRVPDWWLVNVEARWATGTRLLSAVLVVQDRGDAGYSAGGIRARFAEALFDRYSASPPSPRVPLAMGAPGIGDVLALDEARRWCIAAPADPERIAALIYSTLYVWQRPVKGPSSNISSAGELQSDFVPDGWFVTYSWHAVNAADKPVGRTGTGSMTFRNSSNSLSTVFAPGPATRSIWQITISRETPTTFGPVKYQFDVPWPTGAAMNHVPPRKPK